jgi:hypothetical protein
VKTERCAFNFCSWWRNGVYEEWKPEILDCRRHLSPGLVLRPHSTSSETRLWVINWFRYPKKSFLIHPYYGPVSLLIFAWGFPKLEFFVFQVYRLRYCQWWGLASRNLGRYFQLVLCLLCPWSWSEALATLQGSDAFHDWVSFWKFSSGRIRAAFLSEWCMIVFITSSVSIAYRFYYDIRTWTWELKLEICTTWDFHWLIQQLEVANNSELDLVANWCDPSIVFVLIQQPMFIWV